MKRKILILTILLGALLLGSAMSVLSATYTVRETASTASERAALIDAGNLDGKLYTAYYDESQDKIAVSRVGLDGLVKATEYLKGGIGNTITGRGKIQVSSAGNRLYIAWIERDSEVIANDRLYVASTTNGEDYIVSEVASSTTIHWADVAGSGGIVYAVYGVTGGDVLSKRSTDGGLSFSSAAYIFDSTDPQQNLVQISAAVGSGIVGVAFSYKKHVVGDPDTYPIEVQYSQTTITVNSWSGPSQVSSANPPDESSIAKHIGITYSKSGRAWVAWGAESGTAIYYKVRGTGGSWGSLKFFTSSNTHVSSVVLHGFTATFGEGAVVAYSKGASSSVFYRYAKTDGNFDSEQTLASGSGLFVSSTDLLGRPAAFFVGSDNYFKVAFDAFAGAGRTGKKRYVLLNEGFESSNVRNSQFWKVSYDGGKENCVFSETSNWKATGSKSLWAAGWLNGATNTTGKYVWNMATNIERLFDVSGFESAETAMKYSLSTNYDPGDIATFGLEDYLTVTDTAGTGSNFLSYARFYDKSDFTTSVVSLRARFVSDGDSVAANALSLLIDDLVVYGYNLPRPTITEIQQIATGLRVIFDNPLPGTTTHVYRSTNEVGPFAKVGATTGSYYDDTLTSSGTYYYQVVIEDGVDESAPSNTLSQSWTATLLISASPSSFTFSANLGGSNPPSQTLSIQRAGVGTLNWTVSDNATWLSLSPTSGQSTGEIDSVTVSVNISGLSVGTYNATIAVSDPNASNSPVYIPVSLVIDEGPATAERISGANRILTSVEVSKDTFTKAPAVVLATAYNFPDALSATPLAYAVGGPILLTTKDSLPSSVEAEINRLGATKVYLIGGTGVISNTVKTYLESKGKTVERIGGANRYDTARLIALKLKVILSVASFTKAYIATGENFPDALAAGPVSSKDMSPILLVKKTLVPSETQSALSSLLVSETVVIGGEGVISDSVKNALPSATRIAGANRYRTAVAVANYALSNLSPDTSEIYIATGTNYPDALSSGVAAAKNNNLLLLVPTSLPLDSQLSSFLSNHKEINEVKVIGGEGAVPQAVVGAVLGILK